MACFSGTPFAAPGPKQFSFLEDTGKHRVAPSDGEEPLAPEFTATSRYTDFAHPGATPLGHPMYVPWTSPGG